MKKLLLCACLIFFSTVNTEAMIFQNNTGIDYLVIAVKSDKDRLVSHLLLNSPYERLEINRLNYPRDINGIRFDIGGVTCAEASFKDQTIDELNKKKIEITYEEKSKRYKCQIF